ncbi:MAG: hypothetical protein M1837_006897 [Sclerophora amabilis]|nr:MAG: hypothetical protein M1837_006897 [Sclerophora amabilis]
MQDEAASASGLTGAPASPSSSPDRLEPSTNDHGVNLSDSLLRLTLDTSSAMRLPDSPQRDRPNEPDSPAQSMSARHGMGSPRPLVRRSASSKSLDLRSFTPTLNKKSSVSSLQRSGPATSPRSISRRSSINVAPSSPATMRSKSPSGTTFDHTVPLLPPTAASVANASLQREMQLHNEGGLVQNTGQTVVIVHDSCYGHRFSRPRTSRANLATIVERPERIHASIVGVSMAYVRLGGRHAEGKYAPNPKQDPKLHTTIPFRIQKSARAISLSSSIVTSVHGAGWMDELKRMCEMAEAKLDLNGKELIRPESSTEDDGNVAKPKLHEGDLYLCGQSLDALEGSLGAVCDGVDQVFSGAKSQDGPRRAFVCIRPPGHHCSSSYPSGFCWLNNVHVGISHAAATHGLTHAVIIDFDLHHGDGSQSITWAHNARMMRLPKNASNSKRCPIGYFSVHDINSYPCEMGDEDKVRNASLCLENAHGQTIWNVHLQPWKTEAEFWDLYETRYSIIIEKTRTFLRAHNQRLRSSTASPAPKAAIFVSAGFDASEWEGAGMQRHKVNVPTDFYARISQDIVNLAEEDDLGVDGRVISVLEGGYSDRALSSGVLSHLSGMAGATPEKGKPSHAQSNGLGYEMGKKFGVVDGELQDRGLSNLQTPSFDPSWWALKRLEELEALINPPLPPPIPKKKRNATPPTYTTPTQSFTAKIVSSPKAYRSVSGTDKQSSPRSPSLHSRAATPPPPDVDWATAAHELSKLLIPSDRQTQSCKPEELSAEASRVRRQRHSTIGLSSEHEGNNGKRMTLRERKNHAPSYTVDEEEEEVDSRPVSRASRRKTVAGLSLLPENAAIQDNSGPTESVKQPTGRPRRRSSIASSVTSIGDVPSLARMDNQHSNGGSSRVVSQEGSMTSSKATVTAKNNTNSTAPRKPRVSPQSRIDNPKSRTTKKTTSNPPLPLDQPPPEPKSLGSVPPTAPSKDKESQDHDGPVDNLTSSLTRIKINVPSREEHDARERKSNSTAAGGKKAAPAKGGRKSAAPKATKSLKSTTHKAEAKPAPSGTASTSAGQAREPTSNGSHRGPPETHDNVVPVSTSESAHDEPPIFASNPSATSTPIPPEGPPLSNVPIEPTNPFPPDTGSAQSSTAHYQEPQQLPTQPLPQPQQQLEFIPYVPPPPLDPRPTSNTAPASAPPPKIQKPSTTPLVTNTNHHTSPPSQCRPHSPPPSTTTTPTRFKREDLPTFTSSSPIPFGKAPQTQPQYAPEKSSVGGPVKMEMEHKAPDGEKAEYGPRKAEKAKEEEEGGEGDIWSIPDTPIQLQDSGQRAGRQTPA